MDIRQLMYIDFAHVPSPSFSISSREREKEEVERSRSTQRWISERMFSRFVYALGAEDGILISRFYIAVHSPDETLRSSVRTHTPHTHTITRSIIL